MMEKRNFVTPIRTADASSDGDELISSAANLFLKTAAESPVASDFEKKASEEDEKSDLLG